MSFEIAFNNIIKDKGLEAIKDNFMFFSMLIDFKNKTRIDIAKMKMFYTLNSYLNLYDLIKRNETSVVFEYLKDFINQNPFNYSTINMLICLEPLMNFVDKNGYELFVLPYLNSHKENTAKIVKTRKKPMKEVANKVSVQLKQLFINIESYSAELYLTDDDELAVSKRGSLKTKIVSSNITSQQNISYSIKHKHELIKVYIPKKYSNEMHINFSGSLLKIDFNDNYKKLRNLSVKSDSISTIIDGEFNTLETSGKGSLCLNAFAIQTNINDYWDVKYFLRNRNVTNSKKRAIKVDASRVKINASEKFYPKIHTYLKRLFTVNGTYRLGSCKYDLDIKSHYRKIIIK